MYCLENNPLLGHQEEYQRLEQILFGTFVGGMSNKFREVGDISEKVVSFASLIF